MTSFIALLRAVNVGGTGALPMADLKALCDAAGFQRVRTYIASGNVVFQSALSEAKAKAALEARLASYAGKPVGVLVRTATEMTGVLAGNPFPDAPGNRVMAIFLDRLAGPQDLAGVTGQGPEEELRVGLREIYVHYGNGQATTKLRIPAAASGTARNINTVGKLAAMAAET
jgi:uncharacterized protein (DUF1697 family)